MIEEKTIEELAEEQKQKDADSRKYLLYAGISLVGIILMVFLIVNFFPFEKTATLNYNGFEFNKIKGHWYTQWQDKQKNIYAPGFRFNPKEVEDVPVLGQLSSEFNERETIYLTFEPNASSSELKYVTLGTAELLLNLLGPLKQSITTACTYNETEACSTRPIITCGAQDSSVILVQASGATGVYLENDCLRIQGKDLELLKSIDRILYQWYKIMK